MCQDFCRAGLLPRRRAEGDGPHFYRALLVVCLAALGSSVATAEGFASVSVGRMVNTKADKTRPAIDLAIGGAWRWLGGEFGAGFAVPSCDGCVSVLSAHVLIGPKLQIARPFVTVGGALLRTNIEGFGPSNGLNDVGASAGGGFMVFPKGPVGFRADVRAVRNLTRTGKSLEFPGSLVPSTFWRLSAGVAFRWGEE